MPTPGPSIEEATALLAKVPHWHQDFEILPGLWTGGSYKPQAWMEWMDLPQDLKGARVLEIGSCDGYFTQQLAARGADIVAVDYQPKEQTGFWVTEQLNDLKVDFRRMNLYDLPGAKLGSFDIVLCLGVVYHLPDPYRALVLLADHCKIDGRIYIETVAAELPEVTVPVMRFYKGRSLVGDITNFWAQSPSCLVEMVEDVGFNVLRTNVLPASGREWTRMILEATRVESADARLRIGMAYGMRIGSVD